MELVMNPIFRGTIFGVIKTEVLATMLVPKMAAPYILTKNVLHSFA